jgi:hypothetical protein
MTRRGYKIIHTKTRDGLVFEKFPVAKFLKSRELTSTRSTIASPPIAPPIRPDRII